MGIGRSDVTGGVRLLYESAQCFADGCGALPNPDSLQGLAAGLFILAPMPPRPKNLETLKQAEAELRRIRGLLQRPE